MYIYKVGADFDNYDVCSLDAEACRKKFFLNHLEDWELYVNFDGSSKINKWWPRIMKRHIVWQSDDDVNNMSSPQNEYHEISKSDKLPTKKKVVVIPLDTDEIIELRNFEKETIKIIGAKPKYSPYNIVNAVYLYMLL